MTAEKCYDAVVKCTPREGMLTLFLMLPSDDLWCSSLQFYMVC